MTSIADEWDDDPTPADDDPQPTGGTTSGGGKRKRKSRRKGKKDEPPPLVYQTVDEFMTEFLAPTIRRRLNGQTLTWCPRWWAHPEVLISVNALWRSWEHLRLDPATGMSTWLLHHCWPHLREIMNAEDGPLSRCNIVDGHHAQKPLSGLLVEKADPSLWLDPAFSADSGKS